MRFESKPKVTHLHALLFIVAIVVVLFLSLPSVYLVIWSIKGTSSVGVLGDFTDRWYRFVLLSKQWRESFVYSLVIALVSSLLSVTSALLYFYFSTWYRRLYQSLGYILLIGPLFFPTIIYGLAMRAVFTALSFPEWCSLTVGHAMLMFPVQYFLLESSNELIEMEWIFGAATMGASHLEIIGRIVGPVLKGPLMRAFAIGGFLSFDEIVIATFVIDSASATVPKRMWDAVNYTLDPTPAVVGTLVLLLSVSAIAIYRRTVSKTKQKLSQDLARDVVIAVAVGLLLRLMLQFPVQEVQVEVVVDASIVILSLILVQIVRLWTFRRLFRILLKIYRHKDIRRPIIEFFRRHLENLEETVSSAFSRDGVEVPILDVDLITKLCFSSGQGVYNGTDSNEPSVFQKKFPQYLAYHEDNMRKKNQPGIRVLLVAQRTLREDFRLNRNAFLGFYRWHREHFIDLLQVDPTTAATLANQLGLRSPDIGIWDSDFAILFCTVDGDEGKLRLLIRPKESESFRSCQAYFLKLLESTRTLKLDNDELDFVDRAQAEIQADQKKVREQWTR